MKKKKITVIGSINMDLVTKVSRIPMVGETVMGESFYTTPGGKGANQAVAAARLGADVSMIGGVGDDVFGRELIANLKSHSIDVTKVGIFPGISTGIASITLSGGDNSIIVTPGANHLVTTDYLLKHKEAIAASDCVILQLEIPMETVMMAASIAKNHGARVILNPAPFHQLPEQLLNDVDYLTPNEHEQKQLLLSLTERRKEDIAKKCIVTKGSRGVAIYKDGEEEIPGYRVEAADTTGAGDTFNGALAFALSEGFGLKEACRFANAAAALSVTKLGAQGGMPTRGEVEDLMESSAKNKS
ncbi:ribokinase [Neobacillus piezotolerans]|uniref:Ribokinase n=1 Tax=Neobacillus piezotolerans TaxID=2259171 RepID=A0A3D8GRC3_9BACI|nr:ribokinase [Neobacillus piezotolerans]RDU36877.1 ribokinase [Neobacillus piezotolerans]